MHRFLGAFTAPAILFFAFTGALQTLSLHEPTKNGSYQPPHWIMSIAQLHKKQTLEVPPSKTPRHGSPESRPQPDKRTEPDSAHEGSPIPVHVRKKIKWPMQAFFVLTTVALVLSTVSGLQTAWAFAKQRNRLILTVAAGVVVPVVLLFL